MPTYDYQCRGCEHEFEHFQSMTAPVKRKCPACGELKLRRLVGSGAGIIFRGSGFYETDYRSESYKKAASAEKKGSSGSDDKPGAGKAGKDATPDASKSSKKKADGASAD